MNKVSLVGRLTRDAEVRYTQGGSQSTVTKFTIAVNRRYKKPNEPDADFINCVAFGKTAEFIGKYFNKGKMIGVTGNIRTSSWDDTTTGQKRYNTEVVIEEAEFVESKASADAYQANQSNNSFGNSNSNFNSSTSNPMDNSNPNDFFNEGSNEFTADTSNSNVDNNEFYSIETEIDNEDLPF